LKIAVFSDSHGFAAKMLSAIAELSPDMIVHLGDAGGDLAKIEKQFPLIPLRAVRGNCDLSSTKSDTELFSVSGVRFFITHGHLFGAKNGTSELIERAKLLHADIVMFGHTHVPKNAMVGGLHVLNPGSCGFPPASFAVVDIDENGVASCRIIGL